MGLHVGDETKAYRYLRRAAFIDLTDLQKNTREGIHAANAGGVWQTVVFGFAGVSLEEDGVIDIRPHMPKEWKGLSFKLHHRGSRLEIAVSPDNRARNGNGAGGRPGDSPNEWEGGDPGRTKTVAGGCHEEISGYIRLILVTVIWGGGFVASDMALDSLTPFQIMTFRFFLGTVILGGISLPGMKQIKKRRDPGRIFHGVCVVCRICAADRGTSVHDTIQKRVF